MKIYLMCLEVESTFQKGINLYNFHHILGMKNIPNEKIEYRNRLVHISNIFFGNIYLKFLSFELVFPFKVHNIYIIKVF